MSAAILVYTLAMPSHVPAPSLRFWSKVDVKPSGCWEWTGKLSPKGYGVYRVRGRWWVRAHRYIFKFASGGEEPEMVCHHCDNKRCVRPDHLYGGNAVSNSADAKARGLLVGNGRKAHLTKLSRGTVRWGSGGRWREGTSNRNCKATPEIVRELRARAAAGGWGWQTKAAAEFGLNASTIRRIVRREMWSQVA